MALARCLWCMHPTYAFRVATIVALHRCTQHFQHNFCNGCTNLVCQCHPILCLCGPTQKEQLSNNISCVLVRDWTWGTFWAFGFWHCVFHCLSAANMLVLYETAHMNNSAYTKLRLKSNQTTVLLGYMELIHARNRIENFLHTHHVTHTHQQCQHHHLGVWWKIVALFETCHDESICPHPPNNINLHHLSPTYQHVTLVDANANLKLDFKLLETASFMFKMSKYITCKRSTHKLSKTITHTTCNTYFVI